MAPSHMMFADLPYRTFKCIAADPPWSFETYSEEGRGRSAEQHYATMSLEDIAQLPVEAYAAPDAFLLLWITGPFLTVGAHLPIMRAWGFEPTAIWGVWLKPTKEVWDDAAYPMPNGAVWRMFMGYTTRQNAEFVVVGRRGSPKRLSKAIRQVMTEPVRSHSEKPEIFYQNVEKFCEGPRLELFARRQRYGWICRGYEAFKFDSQVAREGTTNSEAPESVNSSEA